MNVLLEIGLEEIPARFLKPSLEDMKNYILEEYTFLSRPVFIIKGKIYIGNSKENVETVKVVLENK